jgi:hypothetical protein
MNSTPKFRYNRLLALCATLGLTCLASAQTTTVTTTPVGVVNVTLAAAGSGSVKITTFTPAILRIPVSSTFIGKSRGIITSFTGTSITDTQAGWSAGSLSAAATPYFIKMRSGNAVGAMWQISTATDNTSTSATIISLHGLDPIKAGVTAGDSYELIPADTLDTFFAGIETRIGGTSSSTADTVRIYDGSAWHEYYLNTSVSPAQWREGTATFNKNNTVLRPNSGIIYTRRGTTPIVLPLPGNVCDIAEKYPVPALGVTFISGSYPVDRPLSTLNINSLSGFKAYSGNLANADKVTFFNGTAWKTYNFNNTANQWREGTSSFNKNNDLVAAGSPIIIERGAGNTGSAVLYGAPLPYTL